MLLCYNLSMSRVLKNIFKSKKEKHASLVTDVAPGSSLEAWSLKHQCINFDRCSRYGCKLALLWAFNHAHWHRIHNYLTIIVDPTEHQVSVRIQTTTETRSCKFHLMKHSVSWSSASRRLQQFSSIWQGDIPLLPALGVWSRLFCVTWKFPYSPYHWHFKTIILEQSICDHLYDIHFMICLNNVLAHLSRGWATQQNNINPSCKNMKIKWMNYKRSSHRRCR